MARRETRTGSTSGVSLILLSMVNDYLIIIIQMSTETVKVMVRIRPMNTKEKARGKYLN